MHRDLSDIQRVAVVASLITWAPLVVLAVAEQVAFGFRGALAQDVGIHARMLIALPLAIYAEHAVGRRFEAALRYLADARLIDDDNRDSVVRAIRGAERMRDASSVELVLAAGAVALSTWDLVAGSSGARTWIFPRVGGDSPLSIAGSYYLLVSAPLFRFVVLRWLWRFVVWTTLLIGLGRARLSLDTAHPDRAGGLSVLGTAHTSFGWLAAALSTSLAGNTWTEKLLLDRSVMDYWNVLAPLSLSLPLVLLLPLLALAWPLEKARRRAHEGYGAASADFARRYTRQWIDPRTREPIPLGSSETSTHTDLTTSFQAVHRTQWVPFTLSDYLLLFAATVIPMLVFVVQEVRLLEVLHRIKDTIG